MPQDTGNLQLLASGKSSDFTITCQGVKFKVHQAIICPESSFFRAACTKNSKARRHLEGSWTIANHMRRGAVRLPSHCQRKTQRSSLAS
jgi:BTB/POZ domain